MNLVARLKNRLQVDRVPINFASQPPGGVRTRLGEIVPRRTWSLVDSLWRPETVRIRTRDGGLLNVSGSRQAVDPVVREFQCASLGVGFWVFGSLLGPMRVFHLVAFCLLLPMFLAVSKEGLKSLKRDWRISGSMVDAVTILGALFGGFYFLLIVAGW